jgi:hypothetical protein
MQGALAPVDTCERVRGGAHGEMPGGARRAALGGALASGAPPRGGFRRHAVSALPGVLRRAAVRIDGRPRFRAARVGVIASLDGSTGLVPTCVDKSDMY